MSLYSVCLEAQDLIFTEDDKRFSIRIDNNLFIEDMGIYINTIKKVLSVDDGNIFIKSITKDEEQQSESGIFESWRILYVDESADEIAEIQICIYPLIKGMTAGIRMRKGFNTRMENGMGLSIGKISGFKRASATDRYKTHWTRPVFPGSEADFPENVQFVIWEDEGMGYTAAIPLVGGGMKTVFASENGRLLLRQFSYDMTFRPKFAPVAALSWDEDPYKAIHNVYRLGMDYMGKPGKLRTEKEFPELFNYIGWCSWNAYYRGVTQEKVFNSAESFNKNNFPVGYFIIDDGWQTEKDRRLASFDINDKFNLGLKGFVSKLKNDYGLKYVGFWHAFQGYWEGIAPGSEIADEYEDYLFEAFDGRMIPDPLNKKGFRVYDAYHSLLKDAGADLVKVDNQSRLSPFVLNRIPISYAYKGEQINLQESVKKNFNNAVINCMEMTIENIYYWYSSNVSRSSDDFFPDVENNIKDHITYNIYNSLWFSELTWPDFDMFQTHHPDGELHSVLRAISGGPIYVTDSAGSEKWDILWKLIFKDGRIARPDYPAMPTRDLLFQDPRKTSVPLKAFNRIDNNGVIGSFNVYEQGGNVKGVISPSDIEGIKGDSFALYEHFSSDLEMLDSLDSSVEYDVEDGKCRLFLVAPVTEGFAAIGNLDKYISFKWIKEVRNYSDRVEVEYIEGGLFGAYMDHAPSSIEVNDSILNDDKWSYRNGLLKINAPVNKRMKLTIYK